MKNMLSALHVLLIHIGFYPESEYSRWRDGRADAAERKEGRKEYSEGLRRFFVIVWLIKINDREEGRKSDWSNSF